MRFSSETGTWQLDNLPGCNQICVSHSAFVLPEERNKGQGKLDHEIRLTQMVELLYDAAIATVDMENKRQLHIMETYGWKKVFEFTSSKTTHRVGLFVKDLKE